MDVAEREKLMALETKVFNAALCNLAKEPSSVLVQLIDLHEGPLSSRSDEEIGNSIYLSVRRAQARALRELLVQRAGGQYMEKRANTKEEANNV